MIWFLLLVALVLRLVALNQSLWLDEAISVLAAKRLDLWTFVSTYPIGDFHPPAYFLLLWLWTRIFGFSEFGVRMLSVIFGVLTVYFTYLIGRKLFDSKTAIIATLLIAINPLHVFYSQEARMYSLDTFATVVSFYFLLNIGPKKIFSIGYLLSLVALLYSDYLLYFLIPAQISFIYFFQRQSLGQVLKTVGFAAILLMPWLFVFPKQLHQGTEAAQVLSGWGAVVGGASLKNLGLFFVKSMIGRFSFENKILYGLFSLFAGSLYFFLFFNAIRRRTKEVYCLLLWFFMPLSLAFLISFFIPVFAYFRLIFVLPAFCLLLAKGLGAFRSWMIRVSLGVIVLISILSLLAYYTNPSLQRENWREAVKVITSKVDEQSLVVFEDKNIPAPFEYYDKRDQGKGGLKSVPAKKLADVDVSFFGQKRTIYLFDYLVEINDSQKLIDKQLINLGYKKVDVFNFPGVGLVFEYKL